MFEIETNNTTARAFQIAHKERARAIRLFWVWVGSLVSR